MYGNHIIWSNDLGIIYSEDDNNILNILLGFALKIHTQAIIAIF